MLGYYQHRRPEASELLEVPPGMLAMPHFMMEVDLSVSPQRQQLVAVHRYLFFLGYSLLEEDLGLLGKDFL
jgi:hypothetical protein